MKRAFLVLSLLFEIFVVILSILELVMRTGETFESLFMIFTALFCAIPGTVALLKRTYDDNSSQTQENKTTDQSP